MSAGHPPPLREGPFLCQWPNDSGVPASEAFSPLCPLSVVLYTCPRIVTATRNDTLIVSISIGHGSSCFSIVLYLAIRTFFVSFRVPGA